MQEDNFNLDELSVGEFLAFTNQILDNAFPRVRIYGEITQLKLWRNQLAFFDLKDSEAVVNCMIPISALSGIEEGMKVLLIGQPRITAKGRFSISAQVILPKGEGAIKKSFDLLKAKLEKEGLFDEDRKRPLPYPPKKVGLITADSSAARADFVKILDERWSGVEVNIADVQVQGEVAIPQITTAIEYFNQQADLPDVVVITRGGGSAEDLQIFNSEQIARAVSASRIPTLVAIGHEVDLSLAELAADRRASTPSNAAQFLVPDKQDYLANLHQIKTRLSADVFSLISEAKSDLESSLETIKLNIEKRLADVKLSIKQQRQIVEMLNPKLILKKGYAIVKKNGKFAKEFSKGEQVEVLLQHQSLLATINEVKLNNGR